MVVCVKIMLARKYNDGGDSRHFSGSKSIREKEIFRVVKRKRIKNLALIH